MVVLKTPLTANGQTIYGWLYCKSERLDDENFTQKTVAYNAYLYALEKFQKRGGSISDDGRIWTDTDGSWFSVQDFMFKMKVYSENKEASLRYTLIESNTPFLWNDGELDDHLILSADFIRRYLPNYDLYKEGDGV